jgi:peptidoglycan/LPS O-acetylase OafA/YrhL
VRLLAAIAVLRALVWMSDAQPISTFNMLYLNIAGRIDQFLLGMLAAWVYLNYRDRVRGWWKPVASMALAVGALWSFNQLHAFASDSILKLVWPDIEGGMWALLVMTYVATCTAQGCLSHALAKVGEASYSIYLIHFMVITELCRRHLWLPLHLPAIQNAFLTTVLLALPVTLAIALLTFHAIEKPFLSLRGNYLTPVPAHPGRPADSLVIEPRTSHASPAQAELAPDGASSRTSHT